MLWGWRALVRCGWLFLCTGYNASQRKMGIWSLRKIIWVVTGSASCRDRPVVVMTKSFSTLYMSFFWHSRVGYNGIESWVSEFIKLNSQCIRKVLEKSSKSSKNKWYCPLCKTPVSKRYVIDSIKFKFFFIWKKKNEI